ncbi:hypothetical protein BC936DRAFT_139278 [Jimgerdemannia flammicorona]|uniref:Uncharacterized protein n=1 Tax=Jimgerdemannia flammicorona TaxID=994334 RepID=A0A433BA85_9FUNG|nr:hypothetical protein BC936DRAFT_139278 [Jimgerdemannia flammicorona]
MLSKFKETRNKFQFTSLNARFNIVRYQRDLDRLEDFGRHRESRDKGPWISDSLKYFAHAVSTFRRYEFGDCDESRCTRFPQPCELHIASAFSIHFSVTFVNYSCNLVKLSWGYILKFGKGCVTFLNRI